MQLRLAKRISALLTSPKVNAAIQGRWMQYLMRIGPQLATQVSQVSPSGPLAHLPTLLSLSVHALSDGCLSDPSSPACRCRQACCRCRALLRTPTQPPSRHERRIWQINDSRRRHRGTKFSCQCLLSTFIVPAVGVQLGNPYFWNVRFSTAVLAT